MGCLVCLHFPTARVAFGGGLTLYQLLDSERAFSAPALALLSRRSPMTSHQRRPAFYLRRPGKHCREGGRLCSEVWGRCCHGNGEGMDVGFGGGRSRGFWLGRLPLRQWGLSGALHKLKSPLVQDDCTHISGSNPGSALML